MHSPYSLSVGALFRVFFYCLVNASPFHRLWKPKVVKRSLCKVHQIFMKKHHRELMQTRNQKFIKRIENQYCVI